MTRIGRDSIKPTDIPVAGTQLAMGYVNGPISQWPTDAWSRFPDAVKVTIDVVGDRPDADCLDIESGDATIGTAVTWVRDKLARKESYPPVLYCNRASLTLLFNALAAAGFHVEHDFRLWIATLDGSKTVTDMTGVTAVQYAGQSLTGGHYDESIVYDDAWKSAPGPVPAPAPISGILVKLPNGLTSAVRSLDNGKTWA